MIALDQQSSYGILSHLVTLLNSGGCKLLHPKVLGYTIINVGMSSNVAIHATCSFPSGFQVKMCLFLNKKLQG